MEKQKKQFLGMLLVLAVLAAAYGGIHVYNQKQEEKEASEEEAEKLTVVDFKTDDVTAFSYVLGGQVYAYTKTAGEWTWDGDISLTLDTSQIDAMLDAVTGLTAESEITDGEDLAQYGLENPSGIITLTTADGTTTLQLGDKNAVTGQYYLKVAESDKIYLVSRDLSGTFFKTPAGIVKEEETDEPESVDVTEGVEAAVGVDVTERRRVRGQYGRVEDGSKEPLHGQGDGLRNKRKTIDVPDTKDADILNTKCGISNPARRNIPDDPCLSKLGALYRVCPQAGRQF